MDREAVLATQRDALWLIALRARLLRARSEQHLAAARLLTERTQATMERATELERAAPDAVRTLRARRRKVLALVRAKRGRRP